MSETVHAEPAALPTPPPQEPAAGPEGRARWCWYTRLLVAVAVAWALFALAQTLLSGRWWFMLAPDLMPPLLFALVPLLLPLGIVAGRVLRRRVPLRPALGVGLASLLSLGLGLPWSGLNPHAFDSHGPVPPGALRVMSWNTESWGKDTTPDKFFSYLKAQNADVYLLQECIWTDENEENDRQVDDPGAVYREFPGYYIAVRGELVTISRYPIVAQPAVGPDQAVSADPTADWQTVFRAAKVLRTDVKVDDKVLSFYNVHIPVQVDLGPSAFNPAFYQVLHDRNADRKAQYQGLQADLAANKEPFLVAGDFNTSPAMGDLDQLRSRYSDAEQASDSLYPTSWNELGSMRYWRLDWTFTNSGLKVNQYQLKPVPGVSDHRAQLIRVSPHG